MTAKISKFPKIDRFNFVFFHFFAVNRYNLRNKL